MSTSLRHYDLLSSFFLAAEEADKALREHAKQSVIRDRMIPAILDLMAAQGVEELTYYNAGKVAQLVRDEHGEPQTVRMLAPTDVFTIRVVTPEPEAAEPADHPVEALNGEAVSKHLVEERSEC